MKGICLAKLLATGNIQFQSIQFSKKKSEEVRIVCIVTAHLCMKEEVWRMIS